MNKAPELRITRHFTAPRALLYRMWTEKHLMDRWSCPAGFTVPESGADLRPGGQWHATMRRADGVELKLGGTYREIVPDQRLVFTHAWLGPDGRPGPETLVDVTFSDADGGTRMDFVQTGFDSAGNRDGHEAGWSECFDKLTPLVDALKDSEQEINMSRLLGHDIGRVFQAFSNPAGLAVWWGPNGFTTTTRYMDFRAGGSWDYTMHGPDGTDYPNYVRYTAIETNRLIAYDHGTEAGQPALFKAIISFRADGDGTRVTLRLILRDAAQRPHFIGFGAVEGGYQNLARLDAWLDARRAA
ncbi:MAG: SRPBCC family protein [Hyphomicrobiales bacterium]